MNARHRVGWRHLPTPRYGAEKSRKMLSPIAPPTPGRPRRRRWHRLIIGGVLLSLLPLVPQSPVTATAPSGLSNRDWQAIQAQLPASVPEDYLKSASPESLDFFGNAVAVAGDTVVVGVYGEDSDGSSPADNSANGSGAAYVFVRSSAAQRAAGAPTWTQQAYLKASNAQAGDEFGWAVAIAGDTLVVGATGEASNGSSPADNSAISAGAAYVFERTGSSWSEQAYLKAANAEAGDLFGWSVAIVGDTVVVGAIYESSSGGSPADNSAAAAGAAYVFVRSDTTWTQQAYLKAANAESGDVFGDALALAGETLVIGASGEDGNGSSPADNSAAAAGAAYVFIRAGTTWSQQGYLKAANAGIGDEFGGSVAISADTSVVGARYEDSNGSSPADNSANGSGAAYVFVRSSAAQRAPGAPVWSQQGYLKAANADSSDIFGDAVAIAGATVVVGAPFEDANGSGPADNSAEYAGAAYVFVRTGSAWIQQAYLKPSNTESNDTFGASVAIDSATLLVGAPGEDSNGSSPADNSAAAAGATYVLELRPITTYLPLVLRP